MKHFIIEWYDKDGRFHASMQEGDNPDDARMKLSKRKKQLKQVKKIEEVEE